MITLTEYEIKNKLLYDDKVYIKRFKEIKTRKFFFAYVFFLEFCKKRNLYGRGILVNEILFIRSRVYNFFIELAEFIIRNKVINVELFINYILSKGIKFSEWNTQKIYLEYLNEIFFIEPPEEGFFRSLKFIENWSENNNCNISDFFDKVSENYIIFSIENKLLSPWFFYCCEKGLNFLMKIDERKKINISKYFDQKRWSLKLKIYRDKIEIFKNILKEKGL